jgi:hypothetical protein
MIKNEALRRAMTEAEVEWKSLFAEHEEVVRFFGNAVEQIAFGHTQSEKPWQDDPQVSYAFWCWRQHRSLVETEHEPNLFVVVGLGKLWDYPLPFGYEGLGEGPIAGSVLLNLVKLRLVCAADRVAAQLFNSSGLKDAGDRW